MEGDLKEQLDKILPLDEQMLADLVAEEDSTEDEVTEEITRGANLKAEVTQIIWWRSTKD